MLATDIVIECWFVACATRRRWGRAGPPPSADASRAEDDDGTPLLQPAPPASFECGALLQNLQRFISYTYTHTHTHTHAHTDTHTETHLTIEMLIYVYALLLRSIHEEPFCLFVVLSSVGSYWDCSGS